MALQREMLFSDLSALFIPLILIVICYAAFIAVGYFVFGVESEQRIAGLVCSTFNNTVLGVGLAVLYFPPLIILTLVAAQISWVLLPWVTKPFIRFVMA